VFWDPGTIIDHYKVEKKKCWIWEWNMRDGRHDIRYNGIRHTDTQHKRLTRDAQHNNALPLCWVSRFVYCYAECHYAECRSAGCRGALRWDQRYKPFTAVSQALTPPLHTDITNNYEWQTIQLVRPKQKSHYGCEKLYNIGPRWERLNKILCWIQWQNNLWRYTSEGQMAYTVKTFYCSKWCDKLASL